MTLTPRPDRPSDGGLVVSRAQVAAADVAPDAEAAREQVLRFIDAHGDSLHRSCAPGHLTGSALVVDTEGRVVILHHRKLDIWVQPGGHADGVADLAAVALAEASEETGIEGLVVLEPAVDIDIHEVRPPGEQPHLHHDVRFVVLAPEGAELAGNHESKDIRWLSPGDLDTVPVDDSVRRLVGHGLARLAAGRS